MFFQPDGATWGQLLFFCAMHPRRKCGRLGFGELLETREGVRALLAVLSGCCG